ncbi:hypothetical protein CVU37_01200 [candidate division BRC1 bacterium HGW-BRC1-1]|jgi:hypothetical protein|nr:MAG: hypothetical protein CVU37_01200 [candidate division BRC1 bacterium HGW-BRC1-1]
MVPVKIFILGLSACPLLLIACATQPIYVPLSPSHPASPWACETPQPPPSTTLAIHKSEIVPANPDWQIAGIRDNEFHGHAAGQPSTMDMMGQGHMMMDSSSPAKKTKAPGMIKMSAPADKVDYTPQNAESPQATSPAEHEPERHLDHAAPDRKETGYQAAPIAPPMDQMGNMDHMNHMAPEKAPASEMKMDPNSDKPAKTEPVLDHSQHEQ